MKLLFGKNDEGETLLKIDGKEFSTKDYIKMIKAVKSENPIEAEYGPKISEEEKASIEGMLKQINAIGKEDLEGTPSIDDDFDDLPF